MTDEKNGKRIAAYLSDEEHRTLKSRLAAEGKTISKWLRALVVKFLKGNP